MSGNSPQAILELQPFLVFIFLLQNFKVLSNFGVNLKSEILKHLFREAKYSPDIDGLPLSAGRT